MQQGIPEVSIFFSGILPKYGRGYFKGIKLCQLIHISFMFGKSKNASY